MNYLVNYKEGRVNFEIFWPLHLRYTFPSPEEGSGDGGVGPTKACYFWADFWHAWFHAMCGCTALSTLKYLASIANMHPFDGCSCRTDCWTCCTLFAYPIQYKTHSGVGAEPKSDSLTIWRRCSKKLSKLFVPDRNPKLNINWSFLAKYWVRFDKMVPSAICHSNPASPCEWTGDIDVVRSQSSRFQRAKIAIFKWL